MRTKFVLNDNWYFKKGDVVPESFVQEGYEVLNLPHTYNGKDGQDGGNDYYRGFAIYQRCFDRPDGERIFIEFEGVGQISEVYLNNNYLGKHEGAYSIFRYDITDYLQDKNHLVVRCGNRANETVYPQTADFTFYGGIHRGVNLISVDKQHFDLLSYGSNSLKITPKLEDNKAIVEIEAYTRGGEKVEFIIDELIQEVDVVDNKAKTCFEIENPHLWDGLDDPFLYKVKAKLLVDNNVKDAICSNFGIREFKIDPNEGFFLNGRPYPLRGVAKHQDWLDVGSAVTNEKLERDMELILELGATTVRCSHYQHSQYFYDLCDKYGLVVWAEIPYISRHMPDGKENTISQMKELISQNYNHPSIVTWGLSNEITIGGGAESDTLINNHKELNDLCHQMDKTRPTTVAHVMTQDTHGTLNSIPDIASYNHYYGWYVGETSGYAKFFDKYHDEHPNYCIGLSEYGADANPKLHSAKPKKGDYTEEYQCKFHEEVLAFINERPYLWATHVWNMFDFAADARREGDNIGKNQKGLVTMDRELKKDSFYLYKAFWNTKEEFVHLCGRRYVNRHEEQTNIKVYSNLDEVSLYVDNVLFEVQKGNKIFNFVVPIIGEHKIVAKANDLSDEIVIKHVKEVDKTYILENAGAMNWFEAEPDPAYYSINDTYGELMENPATAEVVERLMSRAREATGNVAEAAGQSEEIKEVMKSMSLQSMLAFGGEGITSQDIKRLNDYLQTIKKES